jgi:hypothetical protein
MPLLSHGEVRDMRRLIVALTAALLLTVGSGTALAGTKWCVVDPIITVDGRTSDVTVSFDESNLKAVLAPVTFRFHVPSNSTASVSLPASPVAYVVEVLYDLPARAKRDPATATVDTLVTATTTFAVYTVVLLPRGNTVAVTGASGATTTISYTLR